MPRVAHEILTGKKWKIQHITGTYFVYTIQDFLSKLGMKPQMHLVEISIFSLNHVTVRLTKIMNNLLKHFKISDLESNYLVLKTL